MSAQRLSAVHVGRSPLPDSNRRTCYRCGITKHANGRVPKDKPYLCGDCKTVDPGLAVRLGLVASVTNS